MNIEFSREELFQLGFAVFHEVESLKKQIGNDKEFALSLGKNPASWVARDLEKMNSYNQLLRKIDSVLGE